MLGLCCCSGFSLVVVSRGCSRVAVHRLLIVVGSLVTEHKLYLCGLLDLWLMGLAAPRRVGSSRPGDVTRISCVSCMSRQILYC